MPDEKLQQEVPKDKLPPDAPLKEGTMFTLVSPQGQKIFAKIKEVNEDTVVMDLNHPLAGKDLNFNIKVVGFE